MRSKIINYCMGVIKSSDLKHSETRLEEIKYGLEGIYLLIEKMLIILPLAYFLGILKPLLIFLLIYNIIRMPSFGLHATKSIYCLISSILIFFTGVYLAQFLYIPAYLKLLLGLLCTLGFYKFAPADTHKRPIINPKRRLVYKVISVVISISFIILSFVFQDKYISNTFILSLVIQNFIISPYVYKIFKLPYNNYERYILNNGLN